jgi:hypothetical protein
MTALQYVIKALEIENNNDTAPFVEALNVWNQKLENILAEEL